MCLDNVGRAEQLKKPIFAWKLLRNGYSPLYPYNKQYRLGKWYRSGSGPGFHTFQTRSAAQEWASWGDEVYKVKIKGTSVRGTQDGSQARASEYMMVIRKAR